MSEHFHNDIVSAAWITLVAIAGINIVRFIAAMLASRGIGAGRSLGALVTFGG